jgi:putative acetyltransferase
MTVATRSMTPGEADAVRALLLAAFEDDAEADLVDALRVGGEVELEMVAAEPDGTVAGHVLFSRLMAEPSIPAVTLAPLAVAPDRQRRGLGAQLVRAGLDALRTTGVAGVFVLGEPAYYGRFGFDARSAEAWANPYAGPYFQALALVPGALDGGGRLRYAAPFQALG